MTIPARELHIRDMKTSRSYRWRYRLAWVPDTAAIWWLQLRRRLHR